MSEFDKIWTITTRTVCECDCDCFELCSVHDQLFCLHSSSTGWHDIEWAGKLKYVSEFSYNGVLLNWKRKSLQVFLWIWMPCPPTEKTYNELGLQFFNSNVCNPIYYSASYHLYCISYFITVVLLLLLVFYLRTCEIAIQVTLTHSFTHSDVNKKNKRISG